MRLFHCYHCTIKTSCICQRWFPFVGGFLNKKILLLQSFCGNAFSHTCLVFLMSFGDTRTAGLPTLLFGSSATDFLCVALASSRQHQSQLMTKIDAAAESYT
ncbi:hypothetical protein RIF29_21448 [Crotalaria pallida]|uniref:Uncharacterized protein n=1 Tax=Crotalaria pallida TaxID=3830 RepID=A0AAN9F7G1_CROPI